MPSFFTTFLEKYTRAVQENRGGGMDLGGRYLALILKEALLENPALVKAVLPGFPMKIRGGRPAEDFSVETEIQFRTDERRKEKRYADLEVAHGGGRGFVEIKWEDRFLPGQLDDYIKYCSDREMDFSILYLRPESFTREEEEKIAGGLRDGRKIHFVSCRDLHRALAGREGNVTSLFRNFLEDHIMEYKDEIQRGALLTIMKTGLNWWYSDGLQKLVTEENFDAIPDTWKILLTNAKVLGDRLYDKIAKGHRDVLGNAPVVEFNFHPFLDAKSLKKRLDKNDVEYVSTHKYGSGKFSDGMLSVHTEGGYFNNYSKMTLKSDGCTLAFGVYFYFWPEEGTGKIEFGVFSEIWKKSWNRTEYSRMKKIPVTESSEKCLSIPGEDAVFAGILKTAIKNLENALTDEAAEISPKTMEKLLSALS